LCDLVVHASIGNSQSVAEDIGSFNVCVSLTYNVTITISNRVRVWLSTEAITALGMLISINLL